MHTLPHTQIQAAASAAYKNTAKAACLNTGVIGTGNCARALAAYLSSQNHSVHFLGRSKEKLKFLGDSSLVIAEGKVEGTFPVESSTCDVAEFCANSEVIFVATITSAYAEIATRLAPHLTNKHKIILFSSKLCGTLLFEESIKQAAGVVPDVIETDALFAARVKEAENSIWIRGFKKWTLFSSRTQSKTKQDAETLKQFFPKLSPATNIIQRGLTDFGAVAHAPIALANMNLISRQTPFNFYYEGMTEETIRLLEAVEHEFRLIAEAYGSELIEMKELLNQYYGCDTATLYSAMTSVPNYRHSQGPSTLQHRFLHEDICSSLVPARQLSSLASVKTPMLDSLVNMVSILTRRDLEKEGRSLEDLGLAGMTYEQVYDYVNS